MTNENLTARFARILQTKAFELIAELMYELMHSSDAIRREFGKVIAARAMEQVRMQIVSRVEQPQPGSIAEMMPLCSDPNRPQCTAERTRRAQAVN